MTPPTLQSARDSLAALGYKISAVMSATHIMMWRIIAPSGRPIGEVTSTGLRKFAQDKHHEITRQYEHLQSKHLAGRKLVPLGRGVCHSRLQWKT